MFKHLQGILPRIVNVSLLSQFSKTIKNNTFFLCTVSTAARSTGKLFFILTKNVWQRFCSTERTLAYAIRRARQQLKWQKEARGPCWPGSTARKSFWRQHEREPRSGSWHCWHHWTSTAMPATGGVPHPCTWPPGTTDIESSRCCCSTALTCMPRTRGEQSQPVTF